jgi:putative beta-lysine N-acetyltransferase
MMIETEKIKSRLSTDSAGKRVYLMSLHQDDLPVITGYLDDLSETYGFTKIFVKVKSIYTPEFYRSGYHMEALVPGYFNGQDDAFFMAKYFDEERRLPEKKALSLFENMLLDGTKRSMLKQTKTSFNVKLLSENNADAIATVFRSVFETYPFPVFDPGFLTQTMQEGTRYYGIFEKNELIAVSSAECDEKHQSSEMTDFAVLPTYRGKRLALILLDFMENDLRRLGYVTLFTIARLHELSMNKTFMNAGYRFSGTLTRNTQIAGKIESMNVWYKQLNSGNRLQ